MKTFIRAVSSCIVFLFPLMVTAQKETNIWYFGNQAGLSFNTATPTVLTNSAMSTNEGCATVCDANGSLLFYTDGRTVYNKNHAVMSNGTGLLGASSTSQSATIVPSPGNASQYYIFCISEFPNSVLRYAVVNMSLNSGMGGVVSKNTQVLQYCEESLTVIAGSSFYWVLTHQAGTNKYIAYKLTASGLQTGTPVNTNIGTSSPATGEYGYLKSNLQGTKIAMCLSRWERLEVFDFNKTTGVLSNQVIIPLTGAYGVEFSPDGNILYAHGYGAGTYQYNLLAGSATNIINSRFTLRSGSVEGALQLAPNGKIYIAQENTTSLSVIHQPNTFGSGANYVIGGQALGGRTSMLGLPNIIAPYISMAVLSKSTPGIGLRAMEDGIQISWYNLDEQEFVRFELERSDDGRRFYPLKITAIVTGDQYSVVDHLPATGKNYYRLKMIRSDGGYLYSATRGLTYQSSFPIRWMRTGPGSVRFESDEELKGQYRIFSTNGRLVESGWIDQKAFVVNGLTPGLYVLSFSGRSFQHTFLVR